MRIYLPRGSASDVRRILEPAEHRMLQELRVWLDGEVARRIQVEDPLLARVAQLLEAVLEQAFVARVLASRGSPAAEFTRDVGDRALDALLRIAEGCPQPLADELVVVATEAIRRAERSPVPPPSGAEA